MLELDDELNDVEELEEDDLLNVLELVELELLLELFDDVEELEEDVAQKGSSSEIIIAKLPFFEDALKAALCLVPKFLKVKSLLIIAP